MESCVYAKIFSIEERLWWYQGRRAVCFKLLDRYLPARRDLRILDVGCGTGLNLQRLKQYGDAQGVDMSTEALEFCRQRGVNNVILHEADELPFEDESFDLVTAFDVIEHIDDDSAALREFKRVIRPGGTLLVYTPALPWMYGEHDRLVHHKRRYMLNELRAKIEGAGYQLLHGSYVNFFILPVVVFARLVHLLFPGKQHREMDVPPEPFNWFFSQLSIWESRLVMHSVLPIGLSLAAVARKPV